MLSNWPTAERNSPIATSALNDLERLIHICMDNSVDDAESEFDGKAWDGFGIMEDIFASWDGRGVVSIAGSKGTAKSVSFTG